MTPIILLDRLEEFVKEVTGDIKLQVKVRNLNPEEEKERAANVYKMRLPKKEDQVQQIPYILLQFINGKDDKKEKEPEEEISYSLKALGTDTPMPEGAGENGYIFTLRGSQDVQVGPIEYTHGGVYEYTLSPEISEKEYYTYDTSVYHVKVYVKNTQDGDLTALVVMENGHGEKVDSASFEHNFTGPEPVIETEPETQPQTQPQTEESQSEPQPQKAQIPKTGDVMNLPLWTGILAVSAGVIIFAAVRKKKTQDENTK